MIEIRPWFEESVNGMGDAEELKDEMIWMMDSHEQNKEEYG